MPASQDRPWTPGEWRIEDMRQINGAFWIGVDLPDVGFVSHAEVRAGCDEAREIGDPEANARLIAAAPELFEALHSLLEYHNEGRIPERPALDRAEAALSKALGERP